MASARTPQPRPPPDRAAGTCHNAALVMTASMSSWSYWPDLTRPPRIVQRKVLTPNDFAGTAELADRLRTFESHFAKIGKPFEWTFTRDDLTKLLKKLDSPSLADAA